MRAGRQSVAIEILKRSTSKGDLGNQKRTTDLWRMVWAEFRAVRGGEVQAGRETVVATRVEFVINYAEVMMDQGDGAGMLQPEMVIRCEDVLYQIIEILPDLVSRKTVRVVATQTRVVQ